MMNCNDQQNDLADDSPPTPEQHEDIQLRMRMKERLQEERWERLIRQLFNEDQEKEAQLVYREIFRKEDEGTSSSSGT